MTQGTQHFANAGTVIRGATVISMDPAIGVLDNADVHFADGVITAVGESLRVPEGAHEISAAGKIVMPGLVDSHRHPWQTLMRGLATDYTVIEYRDLLRGRIAPRYRPDDVYAGTLLGDLEALNAGVTTVADLAHIMNSPAHADAAVQAHRDSGLRTVLFHGTPNDGHHEAWYSRSSLTHPSDIRRVREDLLADDTALVTLGMHVRPPFLVTPEVMRDDFRLAAELDIHMSMDGGLGGGCWGGAAWGSPGREPIRDLDEAGLLGPRLTLVHCNNLPASELTRIARTGSHVSFSPDAEMNCGHGEPPLLRLLEHGIQPGLSIDSVVWASGDLFTAMRTTINSARGTLGAKAYAEQVPLEGWPLLAEDVLRCATVNSAAACGLSDRVGSLTPGKQADIVILASDPFNLEPLNHPIGSVVMAAHPGNVESVYVGGTCVKRDGRVVSFPADEGVRLARQARDHVLQGFEPTEQSRAGGEWAWV